MAFSRHLEQRPCGVEMFDCNAHQTYWQKNLILTVDHNGHDLDSLLQPKDLSTLLSTMNSSV